MFPVIGVLVAFAIIVVLRLKNVDFSFSILAGSFILAFTSDAPVDVLVEAVRRTLADPDTLNIAVAVALITVLGYILKETGMMTELIEGLRGVLPARVLLALIPAMFGLLPMPGGALMSAPFNEPEAKRLGLKPEQKTFVNVWFRHLWYWAYPLSPVPILAASLAGFPLNGFLAVQLPILVFILVIGFIVSSSFVKGGGRVNHGGKGFQEVARGLSPIVLAVVLSASGLPIWMALALGVALAFVIGRVSAGRALGMVLSGVRWDLALAVVSMLFFRFVVVESGSMDALFESATGLGIPLMAILVVVPLLVGSISGTPTMGIGIVFPLLVPLLTDPNVYAISVVYAGLVAGYLASPMHLCLVLTNSYYRSELGRVYRYLVPSAAILYASAVAYYLFMNGAIPV